MAANLSVLQGPKEWLALFLQYVFCEDKTYFENCKNLKRGQIDRNGIITITVPMACIVKAHVFQAIRGTRGHSSLGPVCRPTL